MAIRALCGGAALILLASCGGPPEGVAPGNIQGIGSGTPTTPPAEHVACTIGGAEQKGGCTIDRRPAADGTLLTIRHPDGGFRRLRMTTGGADVVAADGAVPVQILGRSDTAIDVAIGEARYRLPLAQE